MTSASMTGGARAEFRAAGTDLSERRRSGVSTGTADRHCAAPDTIGIDWARTARRIGAFTTIAAIAADARIAQAYPGIAAAALGLATPQIRHLATLGGNLAQRSRCWYLPQSAYRLPEEGRQRLSGPSRQSSLQRRLRSRPLRGAASLDHGGGAARLRGEDHHRSAKRALDRRTAGRRLQRAPTTRSQPGEMIRSVELPPPLGGERALYKRAISRSHAEWPLVEVCARAVISGGAFQFIRLTAGGIAPVPVRLAAAEAALQGKPGKDGRNTIADDGIQA
jgi:xanthine dehydrogenase YagS FAD-binding subunit